MEMNDILNGLNSCDDGGCESMSNNNCCCEGPSFGGPGFGGNCGFGGSNGCGLNSWIWILLILFYCGCGRTGSLGGYGRGMGNSCCCESHHDDCCCGGGNYGGGLLNSGLLNNCTAYLFLLVILFLCNGFGRNVGGCGCFGNIGGLNCGNSNFSC